MTPLVLLAATPFIKPARPLRYVLTYVLPVVPLVYVWDGVVSHLHTYSCDELKTMTHDLQDSSYSWEIGRLPSRFFPVTCLLGYPSGSDRPSTIIGEPGP